MRGREARRFNGTAEFTLERNPNGPWSYGSAGTPGEFFIFRDRQTEGSVDRWFPNRDVGYPDVRRNPTGKVLFRDAALLPADALILRPGNRLLHPTSYAVVRFTAPAGGAYRFQGRFEALSLNYGGTTQLIFRSGHKLAENTFINAHGQVWEFDLRQDLRTSEPMDFLVSTSPHGDNSNDSTGLMVTVEYEAGLSPLWFGGLGGAALAGVVAWRIRRRRQLIRVSAMRSE